MVVADFWNHRIQVFTLDGRFLTMVGSYGKGDGMFDNPRAVAVLDDRLYVTDRDNRRIPVFEICASQ